MDKKLDKKRRLEKKLKRHIKHTNIDLQKLRHICSRPEIIQAVKEPETTESFGGETHDQ